MSVAAISSTASWLVPSACGTTGQFAGGALTGLAFWGVISVAVHQYAIAASERITPATWITLIRGSFGAALVGFTAINTPDGIYAWLPATIFALAGLLDAVDGAVARKTGSVSALGERLDTEADGLLVLIGAVLVIAEGFAPRWFLAVGLARYAFVAGVWLRRQRGLAVGSDDARLVTVLPYGATVVGIWIALLPVTTADHTIPLLSVVGIVLLGSFLRSWLVIT